MIEPREEIARIINPYAWIEPSEMSPTESFVRERRLPFLQSEALEKADAILALRSVPAQQEPVAWRLTETRAISASVTDDKVVADNWMEGRLAVQPLYAAPVPPADLAEVLENVREGIAKVQDIGSRVPIELHRACQALTHMTKGKEPMMYAGGGDGTFNENDEG